jgi:hypothetical protein
VKKNILVIAFLLLTSFLLAQNCIILKDALKGKYEGACSNGMANGKGIATGIDSFIGNFKNGYPDGQGKYIWKNGDWYDGHWKEGEFDGQGIFHNKNFTNKDSCSLTGYWKKGTYKGKYEKPYIIHAISNGIMDVVVNKVKQKGETIITLTVKCPTGGALSIGTLSKEIVMSKIKLTDVLVQAGRIERQKNDEGSSTISNRYEFRKIEYPLYATFYFEGEQLQIELLENASYNISISIVKGTNPQYYDNPKKEIE